jgi:hypothetical protein
MISDSERQPGGEKVRAAAARYISGRFREIYPQAPFVTSVRFSAVNHRVGSPSLSSPAGIWVDPPVGMMASTKSPPRVMGTYPVGKAATRVNPLIFHAPPEFNDAALVEMVGTSAAVSIDLSGTQVTGAGLAILAKHTSLRSLRLRDMKVNDAHLSWIGSMPELRGLELSGTEVTDALLPELAKLGQLTELRMARVKMTRSAAPILAGLHELAILDVSETELAPTTLMQLGSWPKLRTLVIEKLDLEKLGPVTGIPHGMLMGVDISHAIVGKSGLRILRLFPMVQKLDLEAAKIVDSDLGPLSFLNNLQTVTLSATGVTEQGVKALLSSCPQLRTVQWGREGEKTSSAPKKPIKSRVVSPAISGAKGANPPPAKTLPPVSAAPPKPTSAPPTPAPETKPAIESPTPKPPLPLSPSVPKPVPTPIPPKP